MEVPRMPKEELMSRIDDPNLVIIDVRRKREKEKMKHAILQDPDAAGAWMKRYGKERTVLLYCS